MAAPQAWCPHIASLAVALFFLTILPSNSCDASPVRLNERQEIDLGFKRNSPSQIVIEGLPLKVYVHAGPNCHSERTHLHYLPENTCIGPLYHPAGSFRMLSDLPAHCKVRGFTDGRCKSSSVTMNRENPFTGPKGSSLCVNMDTRGTIDNSRGLEGVNSLSVNCGH